MTTSEIATYLRIKERKIYDLVASNKIPCTRVTGKLLFPKPLIDLWIASETEGGGLERTERRPPIVAGSHDPLLEWALRQADSGLATLFDGSLNGLRLFLDGEALFCGLHVPDTNAAEPLGATANRHLFGAGGEAGGAAARVVLIEWARRSQGLILPKGNPKNIQSLQDLVRLQAIVRPRQPEAGSRVLLETLIMRADLKPGSVLMDKTVARSEMEAATAIADGEVDTAFGIAAVAKRFDLDFVPLVTERYDLAIDRRDYFEAPFQALLAVTRSPEFTQQAERLSGYDISGLGQIVFNG
ncbi:MAG: helix-turn-helix transcriptional regulator [Alphaproteobacteria bacterium]|nr:helix-turn-helix transcriptional regulator [Alphaproteobacteria bacterium]